MPTYFYAKVRLNRPTTHEDPITGKIEEVVEELWEYRAFYNENSRESFLKAFDPMTYTPTAENATAVSAKAVKTAQVLQSDRRNAIAVLKAQYEAAAAKALDNIAERTDWKKVGDTVTDQIRQARQERRAEDLSAEELFELWTIARKVLENVYNHCSLGKRTDEQMRKNARLRTTIDILDDHFNPSLRDENGNITVSLSDCL